MSLSIGKVITAALATAIIGGCASVANDNAMDIERRLSAAGFQMKLADTPEKIAHLKTLADRRLVPSDLNGQTVFVYADAQSCKCVYVGSQKDYQEYERLSIQQNVVNEQQATAADNEMTQTNAAMNWGLWGFFTHLFRLAISARSFGWVGCLMPHKVRDIVCTNVTLVD